MAAEAPLKAQDDHVAPWCCCSAKPLSSCSPEWRKRLRLIKNQLINVQIVKCVRVCQSWRHARTYTIRCSGIRCHIVGNVVENSLENYKYIQLPGKVQVTLCVHLLIQMGRRSESGLEVYEWFYEVERGP
jgi:hypothetical protein